MNRLMSYTSDMVPCLSLLLVVVKKQTNSVRAHNISNGNNFGINEYQLIALAVLKVRFKFKG